jgi:hypothetical protein
VEKPQRKVGNILSVLGLMEARVGEVTELPGCIFEIIF